ncbi:MAG TPA: hypothetical protein VI794_02335 [Patescibacteria group bacterium]|nr:hypothetical protein [Patescibacteria group bacterium]
MPEEPLTTKQHAVPQQVFGVQFKLVGDLTIRQFAILAICGFFAFIIFSSGLFILFRLLISGAFLLFGIAFAFVPVQDQSLDQWITAFFRAVYSPTRRMWVKSTAPAEFLVLEMPKFTRVSGPEISPEESRRRLETYLGGIREQKELNPLDLAEEQYLGSIRSLAQAMVSPATPAFAPVPVPIAPPTAALTLEEVMAAPTVPTVVPSEVEGPPPPPPTPRLRFVEATKIIERASLASQVYFAEPVYKVQRGRVASYFAARRNTRVGRRLTPLAIAGEMVYAPAREQIIAPELPVAPALATVVEPIAPPPLPLPPAPEVEEIPPTPVAPPPFVPETPPIPIPVPTPIPPSAPEPLPEPAPPSPIIPLAPPLPKPSAAAPIAPPKAGANIIAGVVFDPQGGILDQTLVVVEDEKGNVVRAIKTSELGKFVTSPLPNGKYAVRVPKTPFSFATMRVELTGKEMEEMEIRSK